MNKCPNLKKHVTYDISSLLANWEKGLGLLGWYAGPKTFVKIEYYGGFEYFNTRPYHNHESWGHGWRVEIIACAKEKIAKGESGVIDLGTPIKTESECLVCAVIKALERLNKNELRKPKRDD